MSAASRFVRVLTFNIRYGAADDGPDAWPFRKDLVFEVLRNCGSDFIGLQEALRFQLDEIHQVVPGYGEVGVGRDDGLTGGEYSAILYNSDRWRAERSGTFWLSDTPDVPGSRGWSRAAPRIVTFARFVDEDRGAGVWIYNTHFDFYSQTARAKSAELLAARIAERRPRDPVIVTGDLNAGEDNPAVQHLKGKSDSAPLRLVDTFRVLHPDAEEVGTFNGFSGVTDGEKIDYILVEPDTRVRSADILRAHHDGRYSSDHFPVLAEVELEHS